MGIDQVFVGIHVRCAQVTKELVPRYLQHILMTCTFFLSLSFLISMISLHHLHIDPGIDPLHPRWRHIDCFSELQQVHSWTQSETNDIDIVELHIQPPSPYYSFWNISSWSSWWQTNCCNISHPDTKVKTISDSKVLAEVQTVITPVPPSMLFDSNIGSPLSYSAMEVELSGLENESIWSMSTIAAISTNDLSLNSTYADIPSSSYSSDENSLPVPFQSRTYIYEYALYKGFFHLPREVFRSHPLKRKALHVSAAHRCFGIFPLSMLSYHVYGYDSILLHQLLRNHFQKGFVRNVVTQEIFGLSKSSSTIAFLTIKLQLLFATLLLFFATTSLVNTTLCQTQERMLAFTDHLRIALRTRQPIFGLVLEHIVHSLSFVPTVVGILFFLFEVFDDQLLAFTLLVLVWIYESFTVLFARTSVTMIFFPKLFAIYFVSFGVYSFSFRFGFQYVAMALAASSLNSAMMYYWFYHEVPAVLSGKVSVHRPRMLILRRSQLDRN